MGYLGITHQIRLTWRQLTPSVSHFGLWCVVCLAVAALCAQSGATESVHQEHTANGQEPEVSRQLTRSAVVPVYSVSREHGVVQTARREVTFPDSLTVEGIYQVGLGVSRDGLYYFADEEQWEGVANGKAGAIQAVHIESGRQYIWKTDPWDIALVRIVTRLREEQLINDIDGLLQGGYYLELAEDDPKRRLLCSLDEWLNLAYLDVGYEDAMIADAGSEGVVLHCPQVGDHRYWALRPDRAANELRSVGINSKVFGAQVMRVDMAAGNQGIQGIWAFDLETLYGPGELVVRTKDIFRYLVDKSEQDVTGRYIRDSPELLCASAGWMGSGVLCVLALDIDDGYQGNGPRFNPVDIVLAGLDGKGEVQFCTVLPTDEANKRDQRFPPLCFGGSARAGAVRVFSQGEGIVVWCNGSLFVTDNGGFVQWRANLEEQCLGRVLGVLKEGQLVIAAPMSMDIDALVSVEL